MNCYRTWALCAPPRTPQSGGVTPSARGENTVRRLMIGAMALTVLATAVLGGIACKKGGSAVDQETKTLQTSPPGGKGPGPVTPSGATK